MQKENYKLVTSIRKSSLTKDNVSLVFELDSHSYLRFYCKQLDLRIFCYFF